MSLTGTASRVALSLAGVLLCLWIAGSLYSSYLDYDEFYLDAHRNWKQEDDFVKMYCRSRDVRESSERIRRQCEDALRVLAIEPRQVAIRGTSVGQF